MGGRHADRLEGKSPHRRSRKASRFIEPGKHRIGVGWQSYPPGYEVVEMSDETSSVAPARPFSSSSQCGNESEASQVDRSGALSRRPVFEHLA